MGCGTRIRCCEPWVHSITPRAMNGSGRVLRYADPELGLSFGYVMNRMDFYLWDDPREHALREAATACAKAAGG